ncbi:unnamed protein product [Lymnaea stagnalis]|uniref:Hexosyltransferase n=1 Tax=Lymnaea stagnalis TaxID=6523 RepID=A0AAV2H983_LYMST
MKTSTSVDFYPTFQNIWSRVWNILNIRRRHFRRSITILVLIFTIVFIIKIQQLFSNLSNVQDKLDIHWTFTKVLAESPSSDDEQEKARIRFAEYGIGLVKGQPGQGHSYKGSQFPNIRLFQVNETNPSYDAEDDEAFNAYDDTIKAQVKGQLTTGGVSTSGHGSPRASGSGGQDLRVFLVVLVISRPNNVLLRQAIRKTWGHNARDLGVMVRFVVGRQETWNDIVAREMTLHHDVIAVDEDDTYEYLPNKVFDGVTWVLRHKETAEYLMKVDDDTIVNVGHLVQELAAGIINSTQILGAICTNAAVIRDSADKWAVSILDYPFPTYPTYAFGGGYVMSVSAASLLVETRAKTFDWIHLEDVYITGMLAVKAGLSHVMHPGFSYWSTVKATPCEFVLNKRLTSVNHTEKEMYQMYSAVQELIKTGNVTLCKHKNTDDGYHRA